MIKDYLADSLETITAELRSSLGGLGRYVFLVRKAMQWVMRPPLRMRLIFKQLEFVGNKSLPIIFLSSLFTGAVLGLQTGQIFKIFKAEGLIGAATGKSLALELGPVMCGFIVTGRAGAAMAAEIGTMRVNEQIDAMEAMGVDPVSYLIVPRMVASIIMLPVVTALFIFLGVIGSFIVGRLMFQVDTSVFIDKLQWLVEMGDVTKGLFKAACFGFIFSSIACYKGFYARGGAKGVGDATTQAVVAGLLSILISDFFITVVQSR